MSMVHGNADEANIDNEDQPGALERYLVVRNSPKLPQTLIIKSTSLRVLDPIGQGSQYHCIFAQ